MNKLKTSSLALLSTIIIAPIAMSSATAAGPQMETDNHTSTVSHSNHTSSSAFSATFSISDNNKTTESYTITDPDLTISEFMKSKGMNPEEYISSTTKVKDENRHFKNGEKFVAQKNEVSTQSKTISIPRKVEKINDPTLKAGTEKVKEEGKDGKAIQVTVFQYSENSKKELVKTPKETNLTIVDAPVAKKILVGTKVEAPKPVAHPNVSASSTAPNGTVVAPNDASKTQSNSSSNGNDNTVVYSYGSGSASGSSSSGSGYIANGTISNGVTQYADPQNDVTRGQQILELARTQIGTSYIWGESIPGVGFDCSGLTSWAYGQMGIEIPRTANAQARAGRIIPQSEAIPGDLVHWDGHVGVYAGGNKVVDAGRTGMKISERNIWGNPEFVTFR